MKITHQAIIKLVSIAYCVLGFAIAAPAASQTLPRPTLARMDDIFDARPAVAMVGQRIAFKTKQVSNAQRVVQAGLQARVFSLHGLTTQPLAVTQIDDCNVYLSTVLQVETSDGSEAILPPLGTQWLTLSDSLNHVEPGRYLLKFEKTGAAAIEFRLKKGDEKQYFDSAFVFTVTGNDDVNVETVRAAFFAQRDTLRDLRIIIDDKARKVPCYTYQKLVAGAPGDIQLAQESIELVACSSSPHEGS